MDGFQPIGGRDAWATIRGYVYQVAVTIARWLELLPGEELHLECGEDIDKVSRALATSADEQSRLLEQVKHRERSLSLRSPSALDALAAAITGVDQGATASIPPSDLRDGLPPSVDLALARAARGELDAAGLAAELRATPTATPAVRRLPPSWRWAIAGAVLLSIAIGVALVGSVLRVRPSDSPFLFPAVPVSSTTLQPTFDLPLWMIPVVIWSPANSGQA